MIDVVHLLDATGEQGISKPPDFVPVKVTERAARRPGRRLGGGSEAVSGQRLQDVGVVAIRHGSDVISF